MPIFLVGVGLNSLYELLSIFSSEIGFNSEFLPIYLSEVELNFLYKFLPIFFVFKNLSLKLIFISKSSLLLVKFLLLFDLLFFLDLFLSQGLSVAGFDIFVNKDYIRNSISSFIFILFFV